MPLDRKKLKELIMQEAKKEKNHLRQSEQSDEFLASVSNLCKYFIQVGSTVTCNPPPTDTDTDYLCLVHDLQEFADAYEVVRDQYRFVASFEEQEYDGGWFTTERILFDETENEINLIVTCDVDDFDKFLLASYLAKKFNLLNKQDRVELFSAVRYGNWPSGSSFGDYKPSPYEQYDWHSSK